MNRLRPEDFTVGWISALPIELTAAREMLDEEYDSLSTSYTLGRIGNHSIVMACLPAGQIGIVSGAHTTADLKAKFPALQFCLLVGIGGGVPSMDRDIRLGDVVVSQPQGVYGGVVQYDLGKTGSNGMQTRTGFLNAPPAPLLRAVSKLQSNHARGQSSIPTYLSRLKNTPFDRRRAGPDQLFQSSFQHSGWPTCDHCCKNMTISRNPHKRLGVIHYGTIASGNQVIKDGVTRDRLSLALGGILCFEMEAAGLMNEFPCLVIRGISDYADSHKNSSWQPYAAAAAAACGKEILSILPATTQWKQRETILNWIAPPRHEQKHSSASRIRVEGTGQWLLEHPNYTSWRDDLATPNVLWCDGMQGSGKTVLMSTVIDELRHRLSGSEVPIAFFHFDYQDQQTIQDLFTSLLRQMVDSLPDIPTSVVDAHRKLGGSRCSLPEPVLSKMLLDIMQSKRVYVLIDAVDECGDTSRRRDLLQFLHQATHRPSVRLFLTSRPHLYDIRDTFPKSHRIAIQASEADLRAYVSREISQVGNDIVDKALAERIMNTIVHQADGMFLLSVLHTRTVLKEPTPGDMEDSLGSLSSDLSDAFQATISRIQRMAEGRRRLGITTLMLISHARRTITVSELLDFLSIQRGQTAVRPRHRPLLRVVLDCCQGLVKTGSRAKRVRLAHSAVKEYLVQNGGQLFGDGEANISTLCLTTLLLDPFQQGPRPDEEAISKLLASCPSAAYAARYWGDHVRCSEADPEVWDLTVEFLRDRNASTCATQLLQYGKKYVQSYWTVEECYSTNSLHIASHFGLEKVTHMLLAQNIFPVDAKTTIDTTAITKAASRGHVSVLRMLLSKGADPWQRNRYGDALHCAAEAGHVSTIQELILYGMDPNAYEHHARLPIECTLDLDRVEAFEALVDLGADVNIRSGDNLPFLVKAARDRCIRIVDSILRRRLMNVNCASDEGITAAHAAAINDDALILDRLVAAGANLEAVDVKGARPLDYLPSSSIGGTRPLNYQPSSYASGTPYIDIPIVSKH
ncbi:hypothetical protein FQN51_007063 [Onygenales sp. PD_10]|nr:hypothetical protein FQN51_007063 [Onygenales sp. PD_10]